MISRFTIIFSSYLEIYYYIFYKPARELSLIHSVLFNELSYFYHNLSKSSLKSRSNARGVTQFTRRGRRVPLRSSTRKAAQQRFLTFICILQNFVYYFVVVVFFERSKIVFQGGRSTIIPIFNVFAKTYCDQQTCYFFKQQWLY